LGEPACACLSPKGDVHAFWILDGLPCWIASALRRDRPVLASLGESKIFYIKRI
jgi:hypothetical protein